MPNQALRKVWLETEKNSQKGQSSTKLFFKNPKVTNVAK